MSKSDDQHPEPVGPGRFPDAGLLGDIGERAVAVVVKQDVLAALQPGRPAGHHQSLVQAVAGFRQRRGLGVEVDVVGDEQVEVAVAIVVDKRAAGVPAVQALPWSRGLATPALAATSVNLPLPLLW